MRVTRFSIRIESAPEGWIVHHEGVAPGVYPFKIAYGPYRYRWLAELIKWCVEP